MVQPVFLEYDREALDREYDNRKKVADAAAWLTRFAEESTAARPAATSSQCCSRPIGLRSRAYPPTS